jgi:aminoglycoside phosphotransferase (APT) family kinase protein
MSGAEKSSARLSPDEMSERIGAYVAAEVGVAPSAVGVSGLRRLPGGSSRETWSLELAIERAGAEREALDLVLRRDPPGRSGESDRAVEYRVLQAAAAAGVPVPRVHFCCRDTDVIGTAFFLTRVRAIA